MANDEIPQVPGDGKYLMAEQPVWGTAIADAAAVIELDVEPFEINRDHKTLDNLSNHGTRNKRDSDMIVHTKRAMPNFPTNLIAKKDELDFFLFAHLQSVVEGATIPFDKTFVYPATQPDFQGDAGQLMTFFEQDPASSKSTKAIDCICRSLTLSIEEGGSLMIAGEWIGRGLASAVADPSGTATRVTIDDRFCFEDIDLVTVDYGAGAVAHHLQSLEIVLAYDVRAIGHDGSGSFNDYALVNRQPTFKMQVIKDADYHTAIANFDADTPIDIRIGWGNATPGTDDGDLDFAIHGKIDATEKARDDIISGTFSGAMIESDDGATDPITIIIANAIDRDW